MKRTAKLLMTVLIFCTSFLFSILLFEDLTHTTLMIELDDKEQKRDVLQIFWRNEDGAFSENKSKIFEIRYAYYKYWLDLGTLPAFIRIDPTLSAGHVQIMRVCFNMLLPLYCLSSGNDFQTTTARLANIDNIQYNTTGVSIETQQDDPQIEIAIPPEVSQRVFALEMFSAVLFSSVVTAGFRKLYTWVFSPRRRRSEMESYTNYVKERQR